MPLTARLPASVLCTLSSRPHTEFSLPVVCANWQLGEVCLLRMYLTNANMWPEEVKHNSVSSPELTSCFLVQVSEEKKEGK